MILEWWSENWTEKSLFMVQNVWYLNGLPSDLTLPFEYCTPIMSGIQMVHLVHTIFFILQWGSEIRSSLDFEWSKIGFFANSPSFDSVVNVQDRSTAENEKF